MDSRDDTRTPPAGSPFYEASFIQSASSPASTLMVRIDAFGDAPFGDPDGVVWSPMGGALPQAKDRCLVAESDDGSWWVLAWWSSAQAAGPGQGAVDALDSRLVTLEARPVVRRGALTLNWLTGQNSSQNTTGVAHGFASAPTSVFVEPITTGLPTIAFAQAFSVGLTTFSAAGYVPTAPGSGVAVTAAWTAIS